MEIVDFVRQLFNECMREKTLVIIDELKKMETEFSEEDNPKRNELKKLFDLKIKEIWNEFIFMPGSE